MNEEQKKFELYLTVLRFLPYKITVNLKRLYLDVDLIAMKVLLTAYYETEPSELELELLDDIATNSNACIPDFIVDIHTNPASEIGKQKTHDFIAFAFYEPLYETT